FSPQQAADTAAGVQAAALVCLLFLWAPLVAGIPPHLQHLSHLLSSPNCHPSFRLPLSLLSLLPSFLLPTTPSHCLLLWLSTALTSLVLSMSLWWRVICPSVAHTICSLISTPSPHLTAAYSSQQHPAPPTTATSSCSSFSPSSSSPSTFWLMVRALSLGIVGVTIVSASCSNFAVACLFAVVLFFLCSLISTCPSTLPSPPALTILIQQRGETDTPDSPAANDIPQRTRPSGYFRMALLVAAAAVTVAAVAAGVSMSRRPASQPDTTATESGFGRVWGLEGAKGFWLWVVDSAVQGTALYGMTFRTFLPVVVVVIANLAAAFVHLVASLP
ncbi:hypothetical protein CLOP_g8333, partial [Closterium sp. NIES-67]